MKSNSGFTLIELAVVLAIAAILAALAIPNFNSLIQNSRLTTQANELAGTFSYARSEAVKRGGNITVCASANQIVCSGATAWAGGWIAFSDPDNSATFTAGDTLLRVNGPLQGGSTLTGSASSVQYVASGLPLTGVAVYNLVAPVCTGNEQRNINISATGSVSVNRSACP
jgi:type IV fimbrial biogenesis protein FimT